MAARSGKTSPFLHLCVYVLGRPERGRGLHLRGAERALPLLPGRLLPGLLHPQPLHVALGRRLGRPGGARPQVAVAPRRLGGVRLVADGVVGGRGVSRVRGERRALRGGVARRGAELGVAGAAHHRGGRDHGQDTPTRVGSLSGDCREGGEEGVSMRRD